jgi:hypothetical protein
MNPIESRPAAAAPASVVRPTKAALLEAIDRLRDVDYLADAKGVGPSSEAQTAIELLHKVRAIEELLDLAWVGAAVAQLFMRHAWLQSVRVHVSSGNEYNDEGGSYITHSLRFSDATAAPNVRIPDDLLGEGTALDADAAAELLSAEHEDDAYDFAAPFLVANVVDETTLELQRDTLAELMAGGSAVSGLDAARVMWPDHEVVRHLRAQAPA